MAAAGKVAGWVLAVPRQAGLLLLRIYQLFISPLLPSTCRFYPSCSAYSVQALSRHGLLWGSWLTARRLLRCHPWNPGGVDDVPMEGWREACGLTPRASADLPTCSHAAPTDVPLVRPGACAPAGPTASADAPSAVSAAVRPAVSTAQSA